MYKSENMEFSAFKTVITIPNIIFRFMENPYLGDAQKLVDDAAKMKLYGGLNTEEGFSLGFRYSGLRHPAANFLVSMVSRVDDVGECYFELEWILITINYESLWIKLGEKPSFEYKEMTTLKSVYLSDEKRFCRDLTLPFLDEARDLRILSEVKNAFGKVDW